MVVVVLFIVETSVMNGAFLALANGVRPLVASHTATGRWAITCNKHHTLTGALG
jgi:hypothetical protein